MIQLLILSLSHKFFPLILLVSMDRIFFLVTKFTCTVGEHIFDGHKNDLRHHFARDESDLHYHFVREESEPR